MKNIINNIHKYIFSLFMAAICTLSFSSKAMTDNIHSWELCLTPYVGADAEMRHINWAHDFGGNVFRKNNPQGNIFGGLYISDYLSFEGGYELTAVRVNQVNLSDGDKLFGNTLVNPPITEYGKFQVKDWHANAFGYLPICDEYRVQFIGGVGIAGTKIFHAGYEIADSTGAKIPAATYRTFEDTKTVLRISAGVQQMFADHSGLRFMLGWMNTARLGTIASKENPSSQVMVKNSWTYGLGFFVKF